MLGKNAADHRNAFFILPANSLLETGNLLKTSHPGGRYDKQIGKFTL
jgi:hypothetical protein